MASFSFKRALAPGKTGEPILKPGSVWCPHPSDPIPGIRPNQFEERTKMKIVAKNQNVRSAKCGPMIPTRNLYSASTSHSRKFCAPLGTCFIFRVASWANTIRPTATIQLTNMEFVIGKLKGRAISTGFADKPCACGSGDAVPDSCAEVVSAGFEAAVAAKNGSAVKAINMNKARRRNTVTFKTPCRG